MKERKKIDWPLALAAMVFTSALFIWKNSQ